MAEEASSSFEDILGGQIEAAVASETPGAPAAPGTPQTPPAAPEKKVETPPAEPEKKVETPPAEPEKKPFKVPDAVVDSKTKPPGEKTPEELEAEEAELLKTKPGEAFKRIKSTVKELETKQTEAQATIEQLRQELETAKKSGTDVEATRKQLEEVQKINEQYEQELSMSKIEATQGYQQNITAPLNKIESAVEDMAKRYNVDKMSLLQALAEPDLTKQGEKIAEAAGNFAERDRFNLYRFGEQYVDLRERAIQLRQNATATAKAIEERRQSEVTAAQAKTSAEYTGSLDTSWKELQESIAVLKPVEGHDEWNSGINAVVEEAKKIDIDKLPPAQRASLVVQGASLPFVASALDYYMDQVSELKAQLRAYEAGTPRVAANGVPDAKKGDDADPNLSFLDSIERGVKS